MNAKLIFTNANHSKRECEIFPTAEIPKAERLCAAENQVNGYCKFGVAITPSSCYNLSRMQPNERRELLENIYSKDKMGLSIARLCIASSDYSPELYSYDDIENDTALEHFSIERDRKYIIPIIKEILEINPDLYLFASPWSPPYWMKTGGKMCGGYMQNKYLSCYADYFVKFIKAYGAEGIKISAVTPQNELETQQNGSMPACIWHPETEAEFIKILKCKLNENSLDTEIWMYDHCFSNTDRVIWSLDNYKGLSDACDGVAFHYYDGSIERTQLLAEKYPELPLHFTEGGPRLTDNYETDWCKWGIMAVKALKHSYKSFTGWNLMLDELGGPNIGPFMGTCGGFVTRNAQSEELSFSGQYKAFSYIVPHINKNSKIYALVNSRPFSNDIMTNYPAYRRSIEGVVIKNPDKTVAIIINPNSSKMQTQIELCGKLWYTELQENSISALEVTE